MDANAENQKAEDQDLPIETPPARLLRLLRTVALGPEQLDGEQVGMVLARALGQEPVSLQGSWSVAHSELLTLLSDAKDFVRDRIPEFEGSPHEATFKELNEILSSFALNDAWRGHRRQLKTLVQSALPFSVFQVKMGSVPDVVSAADVKAILRDLSNLIERVTASDWPTTFKAEMLEALRKLQDRLTRFHVFGPEGVSAATATIVGTLMMNESTAQSNSQLTKEITEQLNRIADLFLKYFTIGAITGQVLHRLVAGS